MIIFLHILELNGQKSRKKRNNAEKNKIILQNFGTLFYLIYYFHLWIRWKYQNISGTLWIFRNLIYSHDLVSQSQLTVSHAVQAFSFECKFHYFIFPHSAGFSLHLTYRRDSIITKFNIFKIFDGTFFVVTCVKCTKTTFLFLTKISGLPRAVILIAEKPVPPVEPLVASMQSMKVFMFLSQFASPYTSEQGYNAR